MNNTAKEKSLKILLGSFILLLVSYAVYFIRFLIWSWTSLESIFAVLILSYLTVLIVTLILLKIDLKKPLSSFFVFHSWRPILIGIGLAILFQALWYGINIALGTKLDLLSFLSLRGYETYVHFSVPTAFALFAVFSVFGAFVEEVAYRGYIQTRISARYGIAVGIMVATIFFTLQHIHIFQLPWIASFFQGQFVNVLFLSVIAGYLFFKTRDIWSAVLFHGVCNLFNISLAFQITYVSPYVYYVSTVTSYVVLFVIIRFILFRKNKAKSESK